MKTLRLFFLSLMTIITCNLFAVSIWSGSSDIFTSGAGTAASPYLIQSADQLAFIAEMVNGGVTHYENEYFKLTTDVDLNNIAWTPIGDTETNYFAGNFDGDNHKVYNIMITNGRFLGLFGCVCGDTIKNIRIASGDIRGLYVGGIAGKSISSCVIINCVNNAYIEGSQATGGIVGCSDTIRIVKSVNNGILDASNYGRIGGIVGCCQIGEVFQSINYGLVSSHGLVSYVGGIVGVSYGRSSFKYCSNFGDINTRSPSLIEDHKIGGIVGILEDVSSLLYCSNTGNISVSVSSSVKATKHMIGGLVGESNNATICFCYNTGSIISSSGKKTYGFIGKNHSSSATVSYCYNICSEDIQLFRDSVTIKNSYNIGGNITNSSTPLSSVSNCYYTSTSSYGQGTKKTEAQMKSAAMPIVLNADSTVFIRDITPNVNDGYPIFNDGHIYTKTLAVTDLSYTSATLNANYYGCTPDSMGFEVQDISDSSIVHYTVNNAQPCSMQLGNLEQGSTFSVKYWLAHDGITYYGDTVMFTTLACPSFPVQSDTVSICEGETYEFAGRTLSASGVYRDSLVAITGCDSVVELVLRIYDTYRYIRYDTIMQGESYDFYGNQLTETGVYNEYIRTTNRCNWVQLNLYVIESQGTGIDNVAEEQKPVKIMEDGHLYILLPDGTRYDATGKKVE